MITGWQELERLTGLKQAIIRRAIGLYGFPTGLKRAFTGPTGRLKQMYTWDKLAVAEWVRLAKLNGTGGFYTGRSKYQKAAFSRSWNDGKELDRTDQKGCASPRPTRRDGAPSYFRRIEQSQSEGWD